MSAKPHLRITAGVVAGLLVLAAALAFVPGVQTWYVQRRLARHPGTTVRAVAITPGHVHLRGVRVEHAGAVLELPEVDAEVGVLAGLLGRGWRVTALQARGWTLDLTREQAAAPPPPPPATGLWAEKAVGGIMAALHLPPAFALGDVALEGDLRFNDARGRPTGQGHVVVTGGGLAAGSAGRFRCSVSARVDDRQAAVYSVALTATLSLTTRPSGEMTQVELHADTRALGQRFPDGLTLACSASAAEEGGRQTFSVSLVRADDQVAQFVGSSSVAGSAVSGIWRLDLRDTDLAPFALGRNLPAFYVTGGGTYEGDAASANLHVAGNLQATAERLAVISPHLAPVGPLGLVAKFDMARVGTALRVSKLETALSSGGPVGEVRALQPFEFNPATGELKVVDPAGDLVGISVKGLPLEWLRGWVTAVDLAGGAAGGEFVLRAEDGRLALRTRAPLVAGDVSISRGGRLLGTGLDVSAFILADYAPEGWQVQFAPLAVRRNGERLLSVEARLGRLANAAGTLKAAGSWSAALPGLLAQPFAAGLPPLTGGDASGNFEASLGETRAVRLSVALANVSAAGAAGQTLPGVAGDLRADFEAGGHVTFKLPVHLTYPGHAADLQVAGAVRTENGRPFVDAVLSSGRLTAEDLGALAALGGGRRAAAPGGAAEGSGALPPPARGPFWPDARGRLELRLDEVVFPRADLHDLRGTLQLEPLSLALAAAAARYGEDTPVRFEGSVTFAPAANPPYTLRATFAADNIASAPFFLERDPGRAPLIEGRFNLAGTLAGTGDGPGALLAEATGTLRIASKDGIFRVLRTGALEAIKQDSSKIASAIDTVSSLFGKKGDRIGATLTETARTLGEIHYDQLNVTAERGPDRDFRVTEIAMIAPEVRITGRGVVTHVDGVPFAEQPLALDLEVGARGQVAKGLDLVGLLGETQDELGYTRLYQGIHLGGTLKDVDPSQWKEMLQQAPLRKGGGLIDKLLGR